MPTLTPEETRLRQGPAGEKAVIRLTLNGETLELASYPELRRDGSGWRMTTYSGDQFEMASLGASGWQVGSYTLSLNARLLNGRLNTGTGTLNIRRSDSHVLEGTFEVPPDALAPRVPGQRMGREPGSGGGGPGTDGLAPRVPGQRMGREPGSGGGRPGTGGGRGQGTGKGGGNRDGFGGGRRLADPGSTGSRRGDGTGGGRGDGAGGGGGGGNRNRPAGNKDDGPPEFGVKPQPPISPPPFKSGAIKGTFYVELGQ